MRTWLVVLSLTGCGRLGFTEVQPCTSDMECSSGHCADQVCCDSPCTGNCSSCTTGTCVAAPSACTGDCASCEVVADGFACAPAASACTALCASATCSGAGTAFACDTSTCCSTADAPNLGGSCTTGPTALLPDGCRFVYDYSSWVMASNFVELMWDEQVCQQGSWVPFDSGADAVPCGGCEHATRNTWTDTCGNASALSYVCP